MGKGPKILLKLHSLLLISKIDLMVSGVREGGCCYRPPTGVSQGKTLPQAPANQGYILSVRVTQEELLPNVREEWRRGQIIVQKEEVREGLRAAEGRCTYPPGGEREFGAGVSPRR